jgi:hypothetical protein
MMDIFETVVPESETSPLFQVVRDQASQSSARRLMNRVFEEWPHRRREFRRDFQTSGFSARTWELALFAYLVERDYSVDLSFGRPDFMVSRDGVTVALEATTTNPPRNQLPQSKPAVLSQELPQVPKDIEASRTELIFQLAKALRRKLHHVDSEGRHYWEASHAAGLPFVIAVEAFHGDTALFHSDSPLASYLYGLHWTGGTNEPGETEITMELVDEHRRGTRSIPSAFFAFPDARHVSAVLFSNASTASQFLRIGIELGMDDPNFTVVRVGTCYNADPAAVDPLPFRYVVEPGKHRETFAQGLRLFHNPSALVPLPRGFFTDISEMWLSPSGLVPGTHPPFAAFASLTHIYPVPRPSPAGSSPQVAQA